MSEGDTLKGKTIRERADECRARIQRAQAELANANTRKQRSDINKRIHMLEGMEQWFRSRAGYE